MAKVKMSIAELRLVVDEVKKKPQKKETRIQLKVAEFIKLKYPHTFFTSESSGIRVPMGLAVQMKKQRSKHKLPDMIILKPTTRYHGLMLELKTEDNTPFKKDGSLKSKVDKSTGIDEIFEQASSLDSLTALGYYATYAVGMDEALKIIEDYMSGYIVIRKPYTAFSWEDIAQKR